MKIKMPEHLKREIPKPVNVATPFAAVAQSKLAKPVEPIEPVLATFVPDPQALKRKLLDVARDLRSMAEWIEGQAEAVGEP